MSTGNDDPFAGLDLQSAIRDRAAACGITLIASTTRRIAGHARAVLCTNDELHLTSITEPAEFVERHLGESLEGAAMLPAGIEGDLLDLGSGNGYPGLVVAAARAGLRPWLTEAAARKASFLREVMECEFPTGSVVDRQIQRASDLPSSLAIRVMTVRAAGDWERVVPRLRSRFASGGELLIWAGETMPAIAARSAWRLFRLAEQRALPGRDRSWIWRFVVG